ncbi:protein argonaute-2-like [Drosophila miranda]|uniref:protein argonaute-2-like n=1 Tax=Drosophila miranda TaxID=7229 RepID=UPI00143F3EEF|nr:protein argonaute-2-like [Drosophila miranda]
MQLPGPRSENIRSPRPYSDLYSGTQGDILCLHVGPPLKNIYLPIELCRIEDGQALNRKDGANQVAAMIKYAATSTNERKAKIIHLLEYFKHNLDPTISHFGIRLENDFIVVNTRTLNAPQVEYKNNNLASVRNGSWRMDRMQFYDPKPKLHKWAILYGKIHYMSVVDFQRMVSCARLEAEFHSDPD